VEDAFRFDRSRSGSQAVYYPDHTVPASLWKWGESFYLLPMFVAVTLSGIALRRAPRIERGRVLARVWSWGWPAGFLAWLVLWLTMGGGTGFPDPAAILLAVGAWWLWSIGLRSDAHAVTPTLGRNLRCFALFVLIITALLEPRGTGLVMLAIVGIVAVQPLLWFFHRQARCAALSM
jgi:hypothetical protein